MWLFCFGGWLVPFGVFSAVHMYLAIVVVCGCGKDHAYLYQADI